MTVPYRLWISRSSRLHAAIVAASLAVASVARAATFTIEPNEVPVGGAITFTYTTEQDERPIQLFFLGPCSNRIFFGFNQDGIDGVVAFPSALYWENPSPTCTAFITPGVHVASLDYRHRDANQVETYHRIDVPFTVLAKLEVKALPSGIAPGHTTLIEVKGLNAGEFMMSLEIDCADGGTDRAVEVTQFDEGFSTIWPSFFFERSCTTSMPGTYEIRATSTEQSAWSRFRVFDDSDGDGWLDGYDNCPNDPNPGQEDVDGDGEGDACDRDNDRDGISDETDNCPDIPNVPQDDLDVDGLGDACDPDIEDDGVPNAADNCDHHWNPGQENADADPLGDACDPDEGDSDNDGTTDLTDNCWNVFNPAQQDLDADGIGTACDPDIDGDGVGNAEETKAGTDPLGYQAVDPGVSEFFDGAAIESGASVPQGEPVGVVVSPAGDSAAVDVTVSDPWGEAYVEETLTPQSPVAFMFVPVFPGIWTIHADANNGEVYDASVLVPEPDAAALGCAAIAAIGLARALRRSALPSGTRQMPR